MMSERLYSCMTHYIHLEKKIKGMEFKEFKAETGIS